MTTIPAGYRLAIVAPGGTILDTVDLEGYDLTKVPAAVDVAGEVSAILARHVWCDSRDCDSVAVNVVRQDIPRGDSFTSLVWRRCGEHTPKTATVISPIN